MNFWKPVLAILVLTFLFPNWTFLASANPAQNTGNQTGNGENIFISEVSFGGSKATNGCKNSPTSSSANQIQNMCNFDKWIELYNPSENVVNLQGYRVVVGGLSQILSGQIAPKSFLVLSNSNYNYQNRENIPESFIPKQKTESSPSSNVNSNVNSSSDFNSNSSTNSGKNQENSSSSFNSSSSSFHNSNSSNSSNSNQNQSSNSALPSSQSSTNSSKSSNFPSSVSSLSDQNSSTFSSILPNSPNSNNSANSQNSVQNTATNPLNNAENSTPNSTPNLTIPTQNANSNTIPNNPVLTKNLQNTDNLTLTPNSTNLFSQKSNKNFKPKLTTFTKNKNNSDNLTGFSFNNLQTLQTVSNSNTWQNQTNQANQNGKNGKTQLKIETKSETNLVNFQTPNLTPNNSNQNSQTQQNTTQSDNFQNNSQNANSQIFLEINPNLLSPKQKSFLSSFGFLRRNGKYEILNSNVANQLKQELFEQNISWKLEKRTKNQLNSVLTQGNFANYPLGILHSISPKNPAITIKNAQNQIISSRNFTANWNNQNRYTAEFESSNSTPVQATNLYFENANFGTPGFGKIREKEVVKLDKINVPNTQNGQTQMPSLEPKTQNQLETQAQIETKTDLQAELKNGLGNQTKTQLESKMAINPQNELQTQTETQPETQLQTVQQTQLQLQMQTNPAKNHQFWQKHLSIDSKTKINLTTNFSQSDISNSSQSEKTLIQKTQTSHKIVQITSPVYNQNQETNSNSSQNLDYFGQNSNQFSTQISANSNSLGQVFVFKTDTLFNFLINLLFLLVILKRNSQKSSQTLPKSSILSQQITEISQKMRQLQPLLSKNIWINFAKN